MTPPTFWTYSPLTFQYNKLPPTLLRAKGPENWIPQSWNAGPYQEDPRVATFSLEESSKIFSKYPLTDPFKPLRITDLLSNDSLPTTSTSTSCDFPGGCRAPKLAGARSVQVVRDLFDAESKYASATTRPLQLCGAHLQANAGAPNWDRQRLAFALLQLARVHRDFPLLKYSVVLKYPESSRLADILDFGASQKSALADGGARILQSRYFWLTPQMLADVFVLHMGYDQPAYQCLLLFKWLFDNMDEAPRLGGMPAVDVLPQADRRGLKQLRDPEQQRLLFMAQYYTKGVKKNEWIECHRSKDSDGL